MVNLVKCLRAGINLDEVKKWNDRLQQVGELPRILRPDPDSAHPGIELQVNASLLALISSGGIESASHLGRIYRTGHVGRKDAGSRGRGWLEKKLDRAIEARRTEFLSLFEKCYAKTVRAGRKGRARDFDVTVAVGVGLDHGHEEAPVRNEPF